MIGCRNINSCIRVIILVVIYDLMSKLKSTCFTNYLKSKVKVINEVKVIKKMKTARNWLKRVEIRKSHFQNFLLNLTFLMDLVIMSQQAQVSRYNAFTCIQIFAQSNARKKQNQTHAVVTLYVGIKWCDFVKMKVANSFHVFLIAGI